LSAVRFFRHRYPFAYKWLGGHVGCLGDKAWRDPPSTPHCGLLGNKALPFLLSTTNSKKRMPLPHLGTGRDPIVDDRLSQP